MKRNTFYVFCLLAIVIVVNTNAKLIRLRRSSDKHVCGVPKHKAGLIVRGQSFSRGDFPWIVALMHTKTRPPSFFCGGTLISSSFVLSAAHCINPKALQETLLPRDVLAIFGAHDLNDHFETGRVTLSPKNIFVHDKWNPRTTQYDSDLSLLEFEEGSIPVNDYVQPICLWDFEIEPTVTEGIVCGWSKSEDPEKKHENVPKLVKARIRSNEQCFLETKALVDLSSTRTFCAGLQNGSGVCFGDSGGGLFINVENVFYLKGIVSSSLVTKDDCDISSNAVFTDVFKFREWISTLIGGFMLGIETTTASRDVYCFSEWFSDKTGNESKTCAVVQTIDRDDYVLRSEFDPTIEKFQISDNKDTAYLPRQVNEKFPNLKKITFVRCGLEVVRDYFFANMANLEFLYLGYNKITTIEPSAFKDLVSLKRLHLGTNLIETLDGKLFATMVKLEKLNLSDNKIKVLVPTTFSIPEGKLWSVSLDNNVCIDGYFNLEVYKQLEALLKDKCSP